MSAFFDFNIANGIGDITTAIADALASKKDTVTCSKYKKRLQERSVIGTSLLLGYGISGCLFKFFVGSIEYREDLIICSIIIGFAAFFITYEYYELKHIDRKKFKDKTYLEYATKKSIIAYTIMSISVIAIIVTLLIGLSAERGVV